MRWQHLYKSKIYRKHASKLELTVISLKSVGNSRLIVNTNLKKKISSFISIYRATATSKINNVCLFSGRHSSVYRNFRISRVMLRLLSTKINIFGLRKSV